MEIFTMNISTIIVLSILVHVVLAVVGNSDLKEEEATSKAFEIAKRNDLYFANEQGVVYYTFASVPKAIRKGVYKAFRAIVCDDPNWFRSGFCLIADGAEFAGQVWKAIGGVNTL